MHSSAKPGAVPTKTMLTPISASETTAVQAEPNRLISGLASSPTTRAPSGMAAIAVPRAVLDSPRSALISGYRGTTFAKTNPLVKKSAATAIRARTARPTAVAIALFLPAVGHGCGRRSYNLSGRGQPSPRESCFSAVSTVRAVATTRLSSGSASCRWICTT